MNSKNGQYKIVAKITKALDRQFCISCQIFIIWSTWTRNKNDKILMLIKVLSKSFCISLYVNCEVRKHLALVFTIQRPHLFLFQRVGCCLILHMYRVFHIYNPRIKKYKKAAKFMMASRCKWLKAANVGWLLVDSWQNSTPPIHHTFIQFFVPFGKEKRKKYD